ncbi:MAG TPA: DEAD/DEAH box helicase, partial [Gemmatimonadaceae bacterium]|nr:DEAD/DEAH box helicase [Gemmatimonadaceae bacterium]
MEQDAKTTKEGTGVTRGQNVLYLLPHDEAAIAQFLAPVLERIDPEVAETQVLAVTADAESAAWLAAAAARLGDARGITAVPATTARRAERLLRARVPHLVSGSPRELLALVRATALKLEPVKALVIAWADQLVHVGDEASLETLLADVPKSAARVIVTGEIDEAVDALVERYARRARRVGVDAPAEPAPRALTYAAVSGASRPAALRRLLDELDPASGTVFVRGDESARVVEDVLRGLGYGGEAA